MPIYTRFVRLEDIKFIHELEKRIFGIDAYSYDFLCYLYIYSDFFEVSCLGNRIVGYIIGEIKDGWGHIITIAVVEEYRRRGIGSRLLKDFIEYAKSKGVYDIYLEVSTKRVDAIRFYEKHGFKKSGFIPDYYRDGSDAYVMRRRI